jgi:hypothetical protein
VLEQVALQFNLEDVLGGEGIAKKITRLMEYLIHNPELTGPQGSNLTLELIEFLFERDCGDQSFRREEPEETFPKLVNSLRLDGFAVDGLRLRTVLPDNVPVAQEENELKCLLGEYEFTTALGHLDQAIAAHTRGDWASANSQLRSFIEALFDDFSRELSEGSTEKLKSSHARREWLAKRSPPFFYSELNEWEINGKGGFVQGFWQRLHPEGSHPGLSDERDCTFRLHLVIIVSGYFLRRFDEF